METIENYIDTFVYKRLETLKLPEFDEGKKEVKQETIQCRKLPEPQFLRGYNKLSEEKWVRNNFKSKDSIISFFLYHTYGILRYEPNSQYPFHKAVPSTRGIQSIIIYVLEKRANSIYISEYDIYGNNLINSRCLDTGIEKELKISLEKGDVYFLLAMDLTRLGYIYGEFSYQLSLLDIGHIIGQFKILSRRLGINGKSFYTLGDEFQKINSLFTKNRFLISGYMINITNLPISEKNDYEVSVTLQSYNDSLHQLFSRSMQLYDFTIKNKAIIKEHYISNDNNDKDISLSEFLYKKIFQRSSAHNILGLTSHINPIRINEIGEDLDFIIRNLVTDGMEILVSLGGKMFQIHQNRVEELDAFKMWDLSDFILQYKQGLTIDSFSAVVFITYRPDILYQYYKENYFHFAHIMAAEILQNISLVYADRFYTRPIKNTNEKVFYECFKKNLVYTLCIGETIFEDFKFDLRR